MLMEIFTIFIPCFEVLRHQNLQQETLESIAQWETNNTLPIASGKSVMSNTLDSGVAGLKSADGSLKSCSNESILTMGALEHVLERNPGPLLRFSALRDFSGENIAFLTAVSDWKASIHPTALHSEDAAEHSNVPDDTRDRFNSALRIYTDYISSRDAEFQINLPSRISRKLEDIFEGPARIICGQKHDVNIATPFIVPDWSLLSPASDGLSEKSMVDEIQTSDRVQYWGEIPATFDDRVFDEAEASIKYLVLTNTWPKFVKERRSSMDSLASA